ncbi:Potassium transporter 26 [Camellia lanceoleosa]|nr:Potassium transporter 26 [Camellia lanceoleosa]
MEDTKLSNGVGVEGDIETGSIGGESGRGIHSNLMQKSDQLVLSLQEYHSVQTLLLAYQSLGIVYGDLRTSPLYVFSSIRLSNPGEEDLLGIFSLIFWTITWIALIKYVFIVLRADDHGEGSTFALYSFLCRHINFQSKLTIQNTRLDSDAKMKYYTLGFSQLYKIQSVSSSITQKHVIIMAVVLLVALFIFQQCGTSKVSFSFSPIMLMWFGSNIAIGVYNIVKYEPSVFKALSPHYIIIFFSRNGVTGWTLLGAIFLCITGAEAMFADLGHFNKNSIQSSPTRGSGLSDKTPTSNRQRFYSSIPEPVYWPMFVISTLAAIVASQSMISATFSIVKQSLALGQVYSPEINYTLMIICIALVVGFQDGVQLGNAFKLRKCIAQIIIVNPMNSSHEIHRCGGCLGDDHNNLLDNPSDAGDLGHKSHPCLWLFHDFCHNRRCVHDILAQQVPQGGWAPFAISAFFLTVMLSWTYRRSQKSIYEAQQKMSFVNSTTRSQAPLSNDHRVFASSALTLSMASHPSLTLHSSSHELCHSEIIVIVTVRTLPITTVLRRRGWWWGSWDLAVFIDVWFSLVTRICQAWKEMIMLVLWLRNFASRLKQQGDRNWVGDEGGSGVCDGKDYLESKQG